MIADQMKAVSCHRWLDVTSETVTRLAILRKSVSMTSSSLTLWVAAEQMQDVRMETMEIAEKLLMESDTMGGVNL